MKRLIKATESIEASGFNRIVDHMNIEQCGFIKAFRGEYSKNENLKRNKSLSEDLQSYDLSFVRVRGRYVETTANGDKVDVTEDTYCVINIALPPEDFIDLMVRLCKKYEQECVLITTPVDNRGVLTNRNVFNIIGEYYYRDGKAHDTFDGAKLSDVAQYFTKICKHKFTLYTNEEPEVVEGSVHDIFSAYGRHSAHLRYLKNYNRL